jgi:hypothetical protein
MLLSRAVSLSSAELRTRIGYKVWNASVLPQVRGLSLHPAKIVKVFEFIPLSSAPGRIRTCAHGSGGRRSGLANMYR